MARRLLNLATLLSLLLCVATVALWVRSYRLGDYGEFIGAQESRPGTELTTVRHAGLYSSHGRLALGSTRLEHNAHLPAFRVYPEGRRLRWGTDPCWERTPFTPIVGSPASRSWTGIDVRDRSWNGWKSTTTSRGVAIPHALLAAATALPPALWLLPRYQRHRRHRRALRLLRSNRCPACGYDLRATPGQCPECGTVLTASA